MNIQVQISWVGQSTILNPKRSNIFSLSLSQYFLNGCFLPSVILQPCITLHKTGKWKEISLQKIQWRLWMMRRSPSVATNATLHVIGLAVWKGICWFIVVKSLLLAHSAISPPQQLLPSEGTCWFILEKNFSAANNANTPSHKVINSRHTFWVTRE